jgi:hypothetical protein
VKISGDNLPSSLARQLQTIYLVSGDEPLLVNEAADAIRATARSQGFVERELYVIERGFDWQGLIAGSRSMSLFAQRKIVEIRMANAAPGEQGADAIVELAEQSSPDTLVLIIAAKLDGRTQSSRWVSAVEKRGVLVQVWPIDLPRLPAWIRERLGRHKLQPSLPATTPQPSSAPVQSAPRSPTSSGSRANGSSSPSTTTPRAGAPTTSSPTCWLNAPPAGAPCPSRSITATSTPGTSPAEVAGPR